jgi:hypothetical protein
VKNEANFYQLFEMIVVLLQQAIRDRSL